MKPNIRRILSMIVVCLMIGLSWSSQFSNAGTITYWLYSSDTETKLSDWETSSFRLLSDDGKIARFECDSCDASALENAGFARDSISRVEGRVWTKPLVNDPYFDQQYGLTLCGVDDAWAFTKGSTEITVAIIDTGIDIDHPEFAGRLSDLSYNAVTDRIGLSEVNDDIGHGTMVAGIIGANIDNSMGIAGITAQVRLMAIKANQADQDTFRDSDLIRAIYYAVDHGADVINMSLGGTYPNPLTREAVDYAFANDVLVVASSGNDGDDTLMYPASFENVWSIGSVDSAAALSIFSNYGDALDLVAPGTEIVSTSVGGTYSVGSGTSFSAPHVTGIAALYLSRYPDASVWELREAIESTASDLGLSGLDPLYGNGLIDAGESLSIRYHTIVLYDPFADELTRYLMAEGALLDLPVAQSYDNYAFDGWFLDEAGQIPYEQPWIVTGDVELYARYRRIAATVTWIVDGAMIASEVLPYGATAVPPTLPNGTESFSGWYLDEGFIEPADDFLVEGDRTYYGSLDSLDYQIVLMNEDLTQILGIVNYSETLAPLYPDGPAKPSDGVFSYRFAGWSEVTLFETDSVIAIPLYRKTLLPGLAGLNPSVDTIVQGTPYVDPSVYLNADGIMIRSVGEIDASVVGIQTIAYEFFAQEELVYRLIRRVAVVKRNDLEIALNKGIATLRIGDVYREANATSNRGEVTIEGTVDTTIPGIYRIVYCVSDDVTQKCISRFVVVLSEEDHAVPLSLVWKKEEIVDET